MKKKNICVLTTSRADYGLLRNTLIKLKNNCNFNLQLLVSGSHVLAEYGNTYQIIEKDFVITKIIKIDKYDDTSEFIINLLSEHLIIYQKILNDLHSDIVMVLGDRYEIFPICLAATFLKIPIIHLCGGDITLGAYDDKIRNMISMMASYHFTTSKDAKNRLINFGIDNDKITIAGHPCLEDIEKINYYNITELKDKLNINFQKHNILIVYHPETNSEDIDNDTTNVISLIKKILLLNDTNVFVIGTNIDNNNIYINSEYQKINNKNFYYFVSLDQLTYLSLAKQSIIYIGNSSSGIYELPYLVPNIINIGNRQQGRLLASNIITLPINCDIIYQNLFNLPTNHNIIYKYESYPTSNIINYTITKLLYNFN